MVHVDDLAVDRTAPGTSERRSALATTAGIIALLMVSNVMSNRVLPDWAYVPWNLTVAAICVWMARGHVTTGHLGLHHWRRGLRWGLTLAALTALVLAIGLAIPATRDLYQDSRAGGGVWQVIYHPLIRIPLGTVVLEEVAFRSVLPALVALRYGVVRASVVASVAFGLWHVLPALGLNRVNAEAASAFGRGPDGRLAAVAFAVIGTTLVGLWWCWLRYRSRSLLTTVLAHTASNSLAYAVAWFVR